MASPTFKPSVGRSDIGSTVGVLMEAAKHSGAVLILDRALAAPVREEREERGVSRFDEVWEGVYIISPSPNIEHQRLSAELVGALMHLMKETGLGQALPTINVSGLDEGWTQDFREPDVVVILEGNPGKDRGTHFQGGPDFLIEILSPNDLARQKLAFYAGLGVREVLLIDRDPWALELHRLGGSELRCVGTAGVATGEEVASAVLPLTFGLAQGEQRPSIIIRRRDAEQVWTL